MTNEQQILYSEMTDRASLAEDDGRYVEAVALWREAGALTVDEEDMGSARWEIAKSITRCNAKQMMACAAQYKIKAALNRKLSQAELKGCIGAADDVIAELNGTKTFEQRVDEMGDRFAMWMYDKRDDYQRAIAEVGDGRVPE